MSARLVMTLVSTLATTQLVLFIVNVTLDTD